jgi:hypothetical protein
MNASLVKAQTWLTELGIRTNPQTITLAINRDDIDALYGTVAIYDDFLNEIRSALGTNKYIWESKDREWIYLNTF